MVHFVEFLGAPRRRVLGHIRRRSPCRECHCNPTRKSQLDVLPIPRVGRDLPATPRHVRTCGSGAGLLCGPEPVACSGGGGRISPLGRRHGCLRTCCHCRCQRKCHCCGGGVGVVSGRCRFLSAVVGGLVGASPSTQAEAASRLGSRSHPISLLVKLSLRHRSLDFPVFVPETATRAEPAATDFGKLRRESPVICRLALSGSGD